MEQVKQDSNNNLYSINNLVDKIWTCKCGAWNAYYRDKCGACGMDKLEQDSINNLSSDKK